MWVFQSDVLRNTGRHTDHNTGGILGYSQTSQEMQCFQDVLGLPQGILLPNGHAMRCPVRPSSYISNSSTLSASKITKFLPFFSKSEFIHPEAHFHSLHLQSVTTNKVRLQMQSDLSLSSCSFACIIGQVSLPLWNISLSS